MDFHFRHLLDRFGATGSMICAVHCALTPLLLAGLAALWAGVLYLPLHQSVVPHAIVMTLGGTLVGLAHVVNLRLNHWHIHDASCAH